MKVKRHISSLPLRSAEDTWKTICDLITGDESIDSNQLNAAASVLHSLISDETFRDIPITITGVSHRLIISLRYRHEAIEEGEIVDAIQWNPTAGNWSMYVPCDKANFAWVKEALATRAPRIIVHKPDERPYESPNDTVESKANSLSIDWGVVGQ